MSLSHRLRLWLHSASVLVGLLVCVPVLAQGLLPVPPLTGHVIDSAGTLSPAQQQSLESKLAAFEASSGSQVVVLIVSTTQPEDIASYSNRVASSWKIGRKDVGDGLLLVVAKDDRKLRIEVARTLEGAIPDLAARRVIDQTIAPRFKQGDFGGGIDAGVEQIFALIRGEALPAPTSADARPQSGFQWMDLAIFLFFAVVVGGNILRGILGSKLGSVATGGLAGFIAMTLTSSVLIAGIAGVLAMVLTLISGLSRLAAGSRRSGGWGGGFPGGGGSWGSGSGGGGGGFSSGGGGSFGGGGASGSW